MIAAFSPDLIIALALFALVSALSPGPNNAMLLASGANFGAQATRPHMAGVVVGFAVMLVAVGAGLGLALAASPELYTGFQVAAALYLLYLAWRIATAKGFGHGRAGGRPMTFLQAAAFQWVNPKAWAGAVGAVAAFAPQETYALSVAIVTVVFTMATTLAVNVWTKVGERLQPYLERPNIHKAFNRIMAALLIASLWPVAVELYETFSGS